MKVFIIKGEKKSKPTWPCVKKCLPPLLKHNLTVVYHTWATPRPDYCHTCSQSRNLLNWTCLTKWSRPTDPQKLDIMPRSKEIQEQMRKKLRSISLEKVIKPFLKHWDSSEPQRESLSTNGENMEQWRTFPGAAGRPKLPHERSNDSSKRSKKTPQQHPKNCRPYLPQLRSGFMTPP